MRLFAAAILTLAISCCSFSQSYTIRTFAGGGLPEGIPPTSANLGTVNGIAADAAGNVYMTLTMPS